MQMIFFTYTNTVALQRCATKTIFCRNSDLSEKTTSLVLGKDLLSFMFKQSQGSEHSKQKSAYRYNFYARILFCFI